MSDTSKVTQPVNSVPDNPAIPLEKPNEGSIKKTAEKTAEKTASVQKKIPAGDIEQYDVIPSGCLTGKFIKGIIDLRNQGVSQDKPIQGIPQHLKRTVEIVASYYMLIIARGVAAVEGSVYALQMLQYSVEGNQKSFEKARDLFANCFYHGARSLIAPYVNIVQFYNKMDPDECEVMRVVPIIPKMVKAIFNALHLNKRVQSFSENFRKSLSGSLYTA